MLASGWYAPEFYGIEGLKRSAAARQYLLQQSSGQSAKLLALRLGKYIVMIINHQNQNF
jgi:hypothetical protein